MTLTKRISAALAITAAAVALTGLGATAATAAPADKPRAVTLCICGH